MLMMSHEVVYGSFHLRPRVEALLKFPVGIVFVRGAFVKSTKLHAKLLGAVQTYALECKKLIHRAPCNLLFRFKPPYSSACAVRV